MEPGYETMNIRATRSLVQVAGLAVGLIAIGAPAGVVHAQSGTSADTGPAVLEEVVVTARLRSEEIQDIPLAMQAMTGEALERAGVQDMRALTEQFAGLQLDTTGGRFATTPVIRGVSQVSRIDDENNVSVFVDGIYVSGRQGLDSAMLDIERVEVVRGPQSALYGRNSYAGAINYITRAPSESFSGNAGATAGSDGKLRANLSLSGPAGDSLGYRIGVLHDESDGPYDNGVAPGLRINGYETDSVSAALRWRASDAFEANLTAYYSDDSIGPGAQQMINGNCQPVGTKNIAWCGEYPSFGDNADFAGFDARAFGLDREILRTGLRLNWTLGAMQLVSLTGYNRLEEASLVDWDRQFPGVPFAVRNTTTGAIRNVNLTQIFTGSTGTIREISQDFRLQSANESPLQWVAGTSYFKFSNRSLGPAGVDITPLAANEVPVLNAALPGIFQRFGSSLDPLTSFRYQFSTGEKITETWAGYGALSYTFAEAITTRAEIRYTSERKELSQFATIQAPATPTTSFQETFTYWTPRFTVDWQQSPTTLLYASAAKGAKAGGFNGAAPTPGELAFGPETNWTYELGAKTDWLEGRLRLNASLFRIDMDAIQITNQSPNGVAVFITQNAGTGRSEGVELELVARVTDGLRVSASYSLADAKFLRARDGSLRSYPAFATNQDVSGQRLPRQAKNLANVALDYTAPAFGGFDWYLHADGRYESERNGFTHVLLGYVGDKTVFNSRIGLTRENLELSLWGRNLTNDDTPTIASTTLTLNDFLRLPVVGLPDLRSYGVSATYRF